MVHAANDGLRPTISGLERSAGDSEQILFAMPSPRSSLARICAWELSLHSRAARLGSKVDASASNWLADIGGSKTQRPDGVADALHVGSCEVEPSLFDGIGNLLAKDHARSALLDKPVPGGPKVPLVSKSKAFACLGERLARTGTGPNRSVVWPAGAAEGQGPDGNSCKPMTLGKLPDISGVNILDAPFVHHPGRDVPGSDEVAQPLGRIRVDLVVVGGHGRNEKARGCGRRALGLRWVRRLCAAPAIRSWAFPLA